MEPAKPTKGQDYPRPPHVFEVVVNSVTYFVGEDPTYGQESNIVVSPESGVGLEQARHWEAAIRQALMPVTPQSSIAIVVGRYEYCQKRSENQKYIGCSKVILIVQSLCYVYLQPFVIFDF